MIYTLLIFSLGFFLGMLAVWASVLDDDAYEVTHIRKEILPPQSCYNLHLDRQPRLYEGTFVDQAIRELNERGSAT